MNDQVATVLAGPGRLFCERLKAGISERQCRVNEARARELQEARAWLGHLHHCLDCPQGEEVKKRLPAEPCRPEKGKVGRPARVPRRPEVSIPRGSGAPPLKSAPEKETRTKPTEMAEITAPSEFCPKHPEERKIVIMKEGPRKGQLLGARKKCLEERKMKAARLGRGPGRRPLQPRKKEALAVVPSALPEGRRVGRCSLDRIPGARLLASGEINLMKSSEWRDGLVQMLPEFDSAWSPEVQIKWFESFHKLLELAGAGGGAADDPPRKGTMVNPEQPAAPGAKRQPRRELPPELRNATPAVRREYLKR